MPMGRGAAVDGADDLPEVDALPLQPGGQLGRCGIGEDLRRGQAGRVLGKSDAAHQQAVLLEVLRGADVSRLDELHGDGILAAFAHLMRQHPGDDGLADPGVDSGYKRDST